MRIALLYPPPWKIAAKGEAAPATDGPPTAFQAGDLDADFYQTPYGLFSLGGQALRAGHQVKVFNLSGYAWTEAEKIFMNLEADLYGLSCWTANRRGVALTAQALKRHHGRSHVVIGGPHATPFAREMLEHYPAIDTVALGESDATFLELIERLERKESPLGIPGTCYRDGDKIVRAPSRPSIEALDTLASPQNYFDTHILMTSRGCPWACTFCGAETTWGRGFRGHSVEYIVQSLQQVLARLSVKMIQIKDDTFTANQKRALAICRAIRESGLKFFWSCDTRVDVLSEELLREMRLAGCQRLSLGVESGSPKILKNIDKKITAEKIIEATQMAKRYGIRVRHYMMLGNRGETAETFRETLEFLKRAAPHEYIFSCLSIYPGTRDFQDAESQGWLNRSIYFEEDFQELKTPFDSNEADTALMSAWFAGNRGLQVAHVDTVSECQAILERLGPHAGAELDLAGAYYRVHDYAAAQVHALRALELDHPTPGLALNYLACAAYHQGDLFEMQNYFTRAAKEDPQHHVLIQNVERVRRWYKARGPEQGAPLTLIASHEFQLLERTAQPTLPGPLPDDYAIWAAPVAPRPQERALPDVDSVMSEGHERIAFPAKRLRVIRD